MAAVILVKKKGKSMGRFTQARWSKNLKHAAPLLHNRRTLWQMLREVFHGTYRLSPLTTIICVLGLMYVFFPFDLITDLLPIIGWTDDGVVIYLMVKQLQKETHRYNRSKAMARRGGRD